MASRGDYRTRQRDLILEHFLRHPGENFTARDLIDAQTIDAGEATIYRTLMRLHGQGQLKRFARPDGSACFQYTPRQDCQNHFHLMCTRCGAVSHLDCAAAGDMASHLKREHGFQVDFTATVIYGLCRSCAVQKDDP